MTSAPAKKPAMSPSTQFKDHLEKRGGSRVAIQIEDIDRVKDKHQMETYFRRLISVSKLHGMHFCPMASWKVWIGNIIINILILIIVVLDTMHQVQIATADGLDMDIDTATMLCGLVWTAQSLISMAFLIWWQVGGRMWSYIHTVMASQKGESIAQGRQLLNRTLAAFWTINGVLISMLVFTHYGPDVVREGMSKYEFFTNPWLKPLHSLAVIHMFMCWNMGIFMFNILVDGSYLMVKHFNHTVTQIGGTGEPQLKSSMLRLIDEHAHISQAIHELDNLFKVYAFTMIATIIPSTLLTIIMLAHRVDSYSDVFILGLPCLMMTLYGFLGLTLAPARLYEEISYSKNALCQNSAVWQPYRAEVYHLALALSAHLEQPNLGLTIWGFAVLSKPLILATFSGMIMVLSLILEFVPTTLQEIEDFFDGDSNSTLTS